MILTGAEIIKEVNNGKIKISDFNISNITTNSYDLTLGDKLLIYTDEILDTKKANNYKIINIPEEGIILNKGDFVLASTSEKIGSDFFVPIIHNKSGIARLGLFIHITADLIDLGSYGNSTLQLFATLPVKIYKGMKIAQVSFWQPKGKINLYKGKYQNSKGPVASKIHLDNK